MKREMVLDVDERELARRIVWIGTDTLMDGSGPFAGETDADVLDAASARLAAFARLARVAERGEGQLDTGMLRVLRDHCTYFEQCAKDDRNGHSDDSKASDRRLALTRRLLDRIDARDIS